MGAVTEIKEMASIYVRIIWQVCPSNVQFQWKRIINRNLQSLYQTPWKSYSIKIGGNLAGTLNSLCLLSIK